MAKLKEVDRKKKIITILKKEYPDVEIALKFKGPFQLLIATILSAQCTDERVNMVTKDLFKKYKSPEDFIKVEQEELEADIRSTGFFRQKAKSIQGSCKMIVGDFGGDVPRSMEELTRLPGVARKTANIVLGDAMDIRAGIAVDTHVKRLSALLKLSENNNPDKIESDLMGFVPEKDWTRFSHLLQAHGRAVCKARRPNCPECVLSQLCPSSNV